MPRPESSPRGNGVEAAAFGGEAVCPWGSPAELWI